MYSIKPSTEMEPINDPNNYHIKAKHNPDNCFGVALDLGIVELSARR